MTDETDKELQQRVVVQLCADVQKISVTLETHAAALAELIDRVNSLETRVTKYGG